MACPDLESYVRSEEAHARLAFDALWGETRPQVLRQYAHWGLLGAEADTRLDIAGQSMEEQDWERFDALVAQG